MKDIKTKSKTTETSIEIIHTLRELDGGSLQEISEKMGLATSTVHRHLATLQEYGYVTKDGGTYRLGLMFLTIGGYAQRRFDAYPTIKNTVDDLAADTGERTQFIVMENDSRVYLYTSVGQSAVETGAQNGKRGPLHASAAGKSILASLPDDRVDKIIERKGLVKTGKNTITDKSALFEQLKQIRQRGYAFNRQETTSGVHAVGAPVTDSDDEVLGGLSVSGPARRLRGDLLTETLPQQLLSAVNELELYIQHSVK
jgi:Transcriptional regulator